MKPSTAAPVGLAVGLAVLLVVGDGAAWTPVVSDFAALSFSTYATVCAFLAARSAGGRSRAAWTTMAAALGAWAIGDLIWVLSEYVLHTSPFPSPADVFYLLFPVLAAVAMAQFAERHQSRLRIVLDGATVALCLFLLVWILALRDVYETYRDDGLALGVALVYPAADVVAVSVAIAVLVRADARQRVVLYILAFALGLGLITDSAFAYMVANDHYVSGTLIDVGWIAVLVMFAGAARLSLHARPPTSPTTVSVPSNSSLWLPYVPLLLAGTIGPTIVMTGLERVIVPFIIATVCVRQSVTAWENRRLLLAAADQALKDPLTGLANQTLFNDRLAHAMMLRLRDNRSVAVVSLDLDDFKLVNDSLGHPTADSLLVLAGERISECVRPGDTVARVGGDEFSVLLESEVDDSHLLAQQVIEAFNKPFVVDGQNLLMRPSVGVAVAPEDEPDLAPDTLVKRADAAMYIAKRSRSSRVHTFTADMNITDPAALEWSGNDAGRTHTEGAAQVRLLGELRRAVDTGGLNVVYQPKFGLHTGRVVGVEALLRWPHPELGTLRPDAFISLVRQHGLMRPVTDLVLDRVLDDAARWAAAGGQMPVAVNLFAPYLHDPRLPDTLGNALQRRALPPGLLTVEITEDMVLTELNVVTAVLRQLRTQGIRVAIDDFGSGYSALSYLRDLSIDEIKMDRRFIASVTTDNRAAAVVRAVIELAHDLDSTVVAEGIEDAVTAAWLRDHGCDIGQGYYFGKPIDAGSVPELTKVAAQPN
ncbi:putative bifunctional diguanylate cyclase/phosphodiesterase [Mycolicibacterium hippocampi]|uniref:GGDEF-domain containing protein n=1 Tax=Mycolicibacterium hippocampi TaxID=659824 RepID=A0A7I9ZRH7_9MYCO|nr:bifunctional diguanylate cyclase/phosphodiesterase [Mycolicibacterium hippocampi]GFH03286.1 GGDEF-domain containing protein [Mycolicibacterium hippocampi]